MKGAMYGVATEGWPFVLLLAVATGVLLMSVSMIAALIPAVLMLLAIWKFRDPQRDVPADPLGVVSPVDGEVTALVRDPDGLRVCLRVRPFGAYLLRSPTEGKVLESSRENGGHGMRIRTDEGQEVMLRLYGPSWLPAAAGIGYGQRVGQGHRCGVVRAARIAEIILPPDADIAVRDGQQVLAGETVLGRFAANGINALERPSA